MRNFKISLVRTLCKEKGVSLEFEGIGYEGDEHETIYIKNIKFHPGNATCGETEMFSVNLGNKKVTRFFKFPDQNADYSKLTFLIKQTGVNGWEVSADLHGQGAPDIAKSSYKVL